jgi:dihydroorotate dehydrogenase
MRFLIRSILFLFPPEAAHHLALVLIRIFHPFLSKNWNPQQEKIGLAAGFDKNAEFLPYLPKLGFGFVEIGTVTPKPQGGNPQPRLFRVREQKAIFNRMGFNNLGAGIISERVRIAKKKLPEQFKVGVNLGKNKLTTDQDAASDYAKVAESFLDCADFFVINVSSPNTPGLRALQDPRFLIPIVQAVKNKVIQGSRKIPLYVKLAPEMSAEDLKNTIHALNVEKIDGLVLTNTLSGTYIYRQKEYSGGYSGLPLSMISLQRLKEVRSMTSMPIISVGGIMNEQDAVERLKAGAERIQVYTGWIYGGVFFAKRLSKALLKV